MNKFIMAHLGKWPNAQKGRDGDGSEKNEWENGEKKKRGWSFVKQAAGQRASLAKPWA